jgi:hypothetical protein
MDMDMRRKILVTGWIKLLFKKTILTPEEDRSTNGIALLSVSCRKRG